MPPPDAAAAAAALRALMPPPPPHAPVGAGACWPPRASIAVGASVPCSVPCPPCPATPTAAAAAHAFLCSGDRASALPALRIRCPFMELLQTPTETVTGQLTSS
jgi:hypothetical protein